MHKATWGSSYMLVHLVHVARFALQHKAHGVYINICVYHKQTTGHDHLILKKNYRNKDPYCDEIFISKYTMATNYKEPYMWTSACMFQSGPSIFKEKEICEHVFFP